MATNDIGNTDPFSDHSAEILVSEREFVTESTLAVGRNASLTLGTDSLIVLDEGLRDRPRFNCCGLLPQRSTSTRSIPYFNVLWAELTKVDITILYAQPTSKTAVRAAYINYNLDSSTSLYQTAEKWIKRLIARAYGDAKQRKRIKLIINPYGGKGKAPKLYTKLIEPIFAAARCEVEVERTSYSGHAVEIAEKLDIDAFDVLAACSGDGVPHELFNGLARRSNAAEALRKIAVVQLPCGSGNAMSWNLNGTGDCSMAALCIVKGVRMPLDLASVTQGDKRTLSFLSQGLGIVAESDLGTDNIRWMGDARFTFGYLVRLLGKTMYPIDIAMKLEIADKEEIKKHYAKHTTKRKRDHINSRWDSNGPFDTTKGLGLPPLRHGTVNDPLPQGDGWTPLTPYKNMGNLYCGNMAIMLEDAPLFPASLPDDGMIDLMTTDGDVGRWKSINLMLSVSNGSFFDWEWVKLQKVSAIRVVPRYGRWAKSMADQSPPPPQTRLAKFIHRTGLSGDNTSGQGASRDGGYFSVDGEKMPFEPFQIEVHKGLGTVLGRAEGAYQTSGPIGWQAFDGDGGGEHSESGPSASER